MSDLTNIEKIYIEKFFGICGFGAGYVLNFSNQSLQEFVLDSVGVDIYAEKYDYMSGSKANRLRRFFEIEDNQKAGKLLSDMVEYIEAQSDIDENIDISDKEKKAIEKCVEAAKRIMSTPEAITMETNGAELLAEEDVLKLIKRNEIPIRENLLKREDLERIKVSLETFLDSNLRDGTLDYLRFQKMKATRVKQRDGTLWIGDDGYPTNGAGWIAPYIEAFENYLGSKKLKRRLEDKNLWIQSNIENDEEHLIIGDRSKEKGQHVHLIVGKTGEIRIDPKDSAPHELLRSVETVLTLKDGKKIRSTKAMLEFEEQKEAPSFEDL